MYPGTHAAAHPDKPAVVMARSGEVVTYRELDDRSNRLAQLWHSAGLRSGDHIAILSENNPRYFEVYWAAIRSGLYFTAVNRYLAPDEVAYIIEDSTAQCLVTTKAMAETASAVRDLIPDCGLRLMMDGTIDGYDSYEDALDAHPATALADQPRGEWMLYSSGTTGQPKGIKRPLPGVAVDEATSAIGMMQQMLYGQTGDSVYLSPAPLYHSAPLAYCGGSQELGGTVVVMEKFDPLDYLEFVETYQATHTQLVPTMFIRMLKLTDEERRRHDVSSLQSAVHAAAPCPVTVKQQMIEWWGPIISEYYAGTEGNGMTFLTAEEWLDHPGSVGRSILGAIHICDDEGTELPVGEAGTVYFEQEQMPFEYHGAPEKTRSAQHPRHDNWSALGDIGYVDDDGYLYLTDRKAFMIISGGVNIYPQEIEDCLVVHPKVADAAVFGIPNAEMGEEVKAVIQPAAGVDGGDDLARELTAYTREHIAHYKVPRSIEFMDELPRLPTGKLYKRLLRDQYL